MIAKMPQRIARCSWPSVIFSLLWIGEMDTYFHFVVWVVSAMHLLKGLAKYVKHIAQLVIVQKVSPASHFLDEGL